MSTDEYTEQQWKSDLDILMGAMSLDPPQLDLIDSYDFRRLGTYMLTGNNALRTAVQLSLRFDDMHSPMACRIPVGSEQVQLRRSTGATDQTQFFLIRPAGDESLADVADHAHYFAVTAEEGVKYAGTHAKLAQG